jgi:hypothetical protein
MLYLIFLKENNKKFDLLKLGIRMSFLFPGTRCFLEPVLLVSWYYVGTLLVEFSLVILKST